MIFQLRGQLQYSVVKLLMIKILYHLTWDKFAGLEEPYIH